MLISKHDLPELVATQIATRKTMKSLNIHKLFNNWSEGRSQCYMGPGGQLGCRHEQICNRNLICMLSFVNMSINPYKVQ